MNSYNSLIFLASLSAMTRWGQLCSCSDITQLHNKSPMKVHWKPSLYWLRLSHQTGDPWKQHCCTRTVCPIEQSDSAQQLSLSKSEYNIPLRLSLNQLKICLTKESSFLSIHHFLATFSAPWSQESLSQASEPIHHFLMKVISHSFQDARNWELWSTILRETQSTKLLEHWDARRFFHKSQNLFIIGVGDSKHPNPLPVQLSLYQHLQVMPTHLSQHPFRCPTGQMMKAPKCKESSHWNCQWHGQPSLTGLTDGQHIYWRSFSKGMISWGSCYISL